MSIYIGGDVVGSKNIWKINDALDTVGNSVLSNTASYSVQTLVMDGSENVYSNTKFGASNASVWKHSSLLVLDTSWGTSGEINPAGDVIKGLAVTPDGKMALGDSLETRLYKTDGTILWSSSLAQAFAGTSIDPTTHNVYSYYESGGSDKPAVLSGIDGSLLRYITVSPDGSTPCGGMRFDRTNYSSPAQMYFFGDRSSSGKILAVDPDSTDNPIWANYTNIVLPGRDSDQIALDSTGKIYLVEE